MIDISHITYEHYPLKKVLMHRPEIELSSVTEDTLDYFHFSAVPDREKYLEEFDQLVAAFQQMGTEVLFVNEILKDDLEAQTYIRNRANMTFTRDLSIITPIGGIMLGMEMDSRKGDPAIIGKVWHKLNIPTLGQLEPDGILEGGGISYFRGDTVIVGRCDRTNAIGLKKFENYMKQAGLKRMITIPCYPGTIHIDGFLVFIDRDLAIVDPAKLDYAPAIIKDLETGEVCQQMMMEFLAAEGVDFITIGEDDGWGAANFVMTAPRQIVGFDWAERVMNEVEKRNGKALGVSGKELLKGNGGPHCMTCALERRIDNS